MAEYIEREAAVQSLQTSRVGQEDSYAELVLACARIKIVRLPAADVAPVRHGRWVEWWPDENALILTGEEMLYCCTACDAKFNSKENMRYCSNCGAKMDGGESK